MIVERTDFISVLVTDMERSKRFYSDTLGLELTGEGGFPAFFHDPDGNALMLHRRHDSISA